MKTRIIAIALTVIFVLACLVSCGANKATEEMAASESDGYYAGEKTSQSDSYSLLEKGSDITVPTGRKIIENVSMSVETIDFDALMEKVEKETAKLGGYIESSSVSGRANSADLRYAALTVRVPAGTSAGFSQFVSDNATVTDKSVTTDDVTLRYVDTESRLSALKTEKEALEKLLAEARTVDEMITVRSRLTDVIYEIESNQSTLRTYDDLVDFSTVDLSIREVKKTAVVEEQGTWQKIGTNLKNNFENVIDGIVAVFVFVVGALPYIVLIAAVALAVLIPVKRSRRRKAGKKAEKEENN